MEEPQYISTKEAMTIADKAGITISLPTVITWCKKYELGHQLGGFGGVWAIERTRFENFLAGGSAKNHAED